MIDLNIVEREILDMGMDDYFGIYEIIWRLNTLYPDTPVGDKYSAADNALRCLLDAGHVRLLRDFRSQPQSRIEPIAERDHNELLRNPVSWYPSSLGHSTVAYESTPTGETRYNELFQAGRDESNGA